MNHNKVNIKILECRHNTAQGGRYTRPQMAKIQHFLTHWVIHQQL